MIANRGTYSVSFSNYKNSGSSFAVSFGRADTRHIRFFLSEPNVVLVQPPLSCHCVLTLSTGPALVSGGEATNLNDEKRKFQILRYCKRGVCAKRLRKLRKVKSTAEGIIEEDGTELSEAGEQLLALGERG